MADLTIKVEGNIESDISKLSAAATAGYKQGNISDVKMGQVVKDIERMQEIAKKGLMSDTDLKEFDSAFKRVAKIVDEAAKRAVKITEEAQKKLDTLKKAEDTLSRKTKERQNVRATRTAKITEYGEYAENLKSQKGISVGNRGRGITKLDTLATKDIDKLSFFRNGEQITDGRTINKIKEELKNLVDIYQATINKEQQLNGEIEKATNARAKAEEDYNKQIEADTLAGKTKNVEFGTQVREATGDLHGDIASMKETISIEKEKQALLNSDLNVSGLETNANKATSSLGKLTKQLSIWVIGLRIAKTAIREVRKTITDLDKSLTEQAMVTGKTRKEVYNLLKSYQELAIQTGSTTKEVSATVTEFIRQGKSTKDAMSLAEAAISAAKVAAINTSDSINYLTTALNGFGLSASQAMEVSDKFAAVSANAATSYEEIAIALSKVASQANLAGMSIDYTTALLAKGLETTREAPETIGTALKTVIARMREITDYGETLEDGVDLNNVESQLAYVGIALRTTGGELRTTEAVLDDLGKKWDTLNSNQQAAIAKALAGTRQQSRLIAMMSDYERVVELQEISARSAGATMAQMGTYTEGLEAALNRLSTSWEKIVSTVSKSDVIINIVNMATNVLDTLNQALNTTGGIITALTIIGVISASVLMTKIREHKIQKMLLNAKLEERKQSLKQLADNKKAIADEKVMTAENKLQMLYEARKNAERDKDTAKVLEIDQQIKAAEQEKVQAQQEQLKAYKEIKGISWEIGDISAQQALNSNTGLSILSKFVPVLSTVLGIYYAINTAKTLGIALSKKQAAQNAKETEQDTATAPTKIMSGMIKSAGWIGAVAGLAILAALGLGLAVALGAFNKDAEQDQEKRMQDLSNSIYTLTKRSEAIQTAVSAIDDLDKKLIKSKQDAEQLADTLAQVGDKLSGEQSENLDKALNESEQSFYEKLTDSEKIEYLKKYQKLLATQLESERNELASILRRSGIGGRNAENERLMARSLAKTAGYTVLDTYYSDLTSTETTSRRTIMEKIVENVQDDNMLLSLANNTEKMKRILDDISNIKLQDGSVASDILQDDNSSLKERVEAFRLLKDQLVSNSVAYQGIVNAYREFDVFASWDNDLLELIDTINITNDEINDLYTSYDTVIKTLREKEKQLGLDLGLSDTFQEIVSGEEYQKALIEKFLPTFAETNMNAAEAMRSAFGELLSTLDSDEYEYVYNAILNQVAKAVQVGIQNIGQNVDKLKNSVSSIYTTVEKWNEMTNTEQSQFLSENAELFAGSDGAKLQQAFILKDYQAIQKALSENGTLRKNIEKEIKELNAELNIELAKLGDERNQATIDFLRERIRQLSDEGFFSVDLETLVEQENKRIEAYKELLQKEEDTLKKSLEDRKAAYEKYFDAVNQAAEDEEYEEKADLFISNLTKLSGSTNAEALAKTEELQNSLAELEKERLQTLRERAQEAVIQSIDDTITSIDKHFEELIATNREILNMLNGTSGNELVASLLSTESFAGKTANEAQSYLNEIQSTFGSQVSNIDWDNVKVTNSGGNLILTINDKVIQLSGQEAQGRNLKQDILAALIQNGISAA